MLHLLLVGLGEQAAVKTMVAVAEAYLRQFCRETNANVYNDAQTWKCEAQPERLKAKGRVTLSTKVLGQWRDYSGVINCQDYDALYRRWFSESAVSGSGGSTPSYTRENLAQALREGFRGGMEQSPACDDFGIHFEYDGVDLQGQKITKLHWHFDDNQVARAAVLGWFHGLVQALDEAAPEAFCSAYISALPGFLEATAHLELYSCYQASDVGRYLLGAEHTIYVGNKMGIAALPGMEKRALKNGSIYTAPGTLWHFDRQALALPLIPGCGSHVWSNFWGNCRQYHQKPQSVHIYARFPSDIANPTVVLAYGLTPEQVDEAACFEAKHAILRLQR